MQGIRVQANGIQPLAVGIKPLEANGIKPLTVLGGIKPLAVLVLLILVWAWPDSAHADVGSTIVGRFWDSFLATMQGRMTSGAPGVVTLLQQAEAVFLGETADITTFTAVQDVYKAMRIAGMMLLALCTVISLAGVTEAGMLGQSSSISDWIKRFCIATFMTVGGIHIYAIFIRIFNSLLLAFRAYLDTHWGGSDGTSSNLYLEMLTSISPENSLLLIIFSLITIVVLFVLWFLIGGIRMAEMAIGVIIAPLVWPLYLIPALEDIPKTAFRTFLGLNAMLLILVAMLRLAVRMIGDGGFGDTVWNFVPAISMLLMTVFLPGMIKRLLGQGNTGVGAVMTAAYALGSVKGIAMATTAGVAAARPPVGGTVPPTPSGPSGFPVAPRGLSSGATAVSPGLAAPAMAPSLAPPATAHGLSPFASASAYQTAQGAQGTVLAPGAIQSGQPTGDVIDLERSDPSSNRWDIIRSREQLHKGTRPDKDGER